MGRVLIIDDSSGSARALEQCLGGSELELRVIPWDETAARSAVEFEPSLVILCLARAVDHGAPRCAALRAEPSLDGVPFLVAGGALEQRELLRRRRQHDLGLQ